MLTLKINLSIILLLFSYFSFAQFNTDSLEIKCDGGKIFTRTEISPQLKYGVDSFQNTLREILKTKKLLADSAKQSITLVISRSGNILEAYSYKPVLANFAEITAIIKSITGHWLPANQNKRPVCALIKMDFEFTRDDVTISFP